MKRWLILFLLACSPALAQVKWELFMANGSCNPVPASIGCVTVSNGLVAYYPQDNSTTSGTTDTDLTANANNGTINAGTTGATGQIQQAYSFSGGATNYVTLPNSGTNNMPDGGSAFSIMAWVKVTADQDQIVLTNDVAGNEVIDFRLDRAANGKVTCVYVNSANTGTIVAGTTVTSTLVGVWAHVGCTFSGSVVTTYVNGSAENTGGYTGPQWSCSGACPNPPWFEAGDHVNASNFCNCVIDDVRFYSRSLSGTEMNQIYTAGLAGRP